MEPLNFSKDQITKIIVDQNDYENNKNNNNLCSLSNNNANRKYFLFIMKTYAFSYSFFALKTLSSKFEVIAKGSSIPILL